MIRRGGVSYVAPTELNAKLLLSGEIDVAPISSIEYGRNADLYNEIRRWQ